MTGQLRSNSLHYTAALLLSRLATIVFLLALPAFLSPADYGVLGLIALAAAFLPPLLTFELGQGLGRYYPTADHGERERLLRSSLTLILGTVSGAVLATLLLAAPLTTALIGDVRYVDAFRFGMLYCLGNILFMYLQNLLRWQFRSGEFFFLSLVGAALMLLFGLGLAMLMDRPLEGVLLGQAIGTGLTLLGGWARLRSDLRLGWSAPALCRMLRFSLPLVPAGVTLFASTYASRLVLQDLASLQAVGHFTWASQVAALPAMLLLGVQAAITPYVMKHHAEPSCPALLARSFELTVAVQLTICLGLGLITPLLIRIAGYDDYLSAGALVLALAPAALLLNLYVFAPGFAIAERSDLQLWVSLASAIVALVANYVLIEAAGEDGAVIASLLSSATFFLLWFAASQRLYPVPFRSGRLLLILAAFVALGWVGKKLPTGILPELAGTVALTVALFGLALLLGLVDLGRLRAMIAPGRLAKV